MIDFGLSLLLALTAPAATPPTVGPVVTSPVTARSIDALVIDAGVQELVALEAAVRLRVGDFPVTRSDRARAPRRGELFAYLEIEAVAADRLTLRLTFGDARAWVRTIEVPADDRTREIATTVANLLAGIEGDTIAPDLRDVPLPPPLRPAEPVAVAKPQPSRAVVARSGGEWGIGAEGLAVVGLGPPTPAGLSVAGLAIRGGFRWRQGLVVMAGVRAGFRRKLGYSLTRVRLELAAGHGWHRGRFALHTTVGFTVEPWVATASGEVPRGTPRRPIGTLLGGIVRLAPMWRRRIGQRSVAVGPFVEIGGSGVPGADGGVARVRTTAGEQGTEVFRAGGLELAAGVSIGVWNPLGKAAPAR